MNDEVPHLLTTREVAELLRVPVSTIHRWRWDREGKGPVGFRVGKGVRYPADGVIAWLAEKESAERAKVKTP